MEYPRLGKIGKLSTGMRQRINLIRALLSEPKIVFMDEPTSDIMDIIKNIKDSCTIAIKDLKEFSRNPTGLIFMLIFPLFFLIITGFIFPTGDVATHMPVAIVDLDHGPESAKLISQLEAMNNKTNYMNFKDPSSLDDTKTRITRGELYGAIIIPEGFSKNISNGKQTNITVLTDKSNPQLSMSIAGVATGAINAIGSQYAAIMVGSLSIKANQTTDPFFMIKPFIADVQGTIPGKSNYFDFVAPGLLIMIAMLSAVTGIPRAISHEKEIGTFDGILSAPINQISIIIGKTIAQTVRGIIQGIIVLILAILLFGINVQGNILLAFLLLILGIFSFIGLGIVMTSMASDEETANIIMALLQFLMMFLSGVFFPVQQMPWFMQDIAMMVPVTYAANAMRKVMILNASVQDVIPELAILIGFGIVTLAIAIPLFRRSMTR